MIHLWTQFGVALGIGLLIGLERERSLGTGPVRHPAGIRTFGLATLTGAVALQAGGPLLLGIAAFCIGALVALAYVGRQEESPGITTEIGLLLAPLLGGLAMVEPVMAAALGATVTVIFAAKAPMHHFVKSALTDTEMKDLLTFAIVTLVVWPLLPTDPVGPFDAISPSKIWMIVVLMLAIGAVGHIATRSLGARRGLPAAGLAGGFVSSVAAIGSMAKRAEADAASLRPAISGAIFSTVATYVKLAIAIAAISPSALLPMAAPLAAGALVSIGYALVYARGGGETPAEAEHEAGSAFSLRSALGLAAAVAVVVEGAAALNDWFGHAGVILGVTLAGFASTQAPTVSIASLVASGTLEPWGAVLPIMAAITTNTLTKCAMSFGLGPRRFAVQTVLGVVVALLAAWAAAAAMLLLARS